MQIEQARQEHEGILLRLMRAINDSEGAMSRAEQLFGLPYWLQHNLRHKRRATEAFMTQVHFAWLSMLERSVVRDLTALRKEAGDAENPAVANLIIQGQRLAADIQIKKEAAE